MTDHELMTAYVSGDRRSFALLFERWGPRLHSFFVRALRDPSAADDLLQQAFLNVHRARASFQSVYQLRSWLFGIAANALRDELRRRRRAPLASQEDQGAMDQVAPADAPLPLESEERALAVRAALARLPESQRVVLYLHRYEEMSFVEIAGVLGTTEGAIKLRAFRAYERLRLDLHHLLKEGHLG